MFAARTYGGSQSREGKLASPYELDSRRTSDCVGGGRAAVKPSDAERSKVFFLLLFLFQKKKKSDINQPRARYKSYTSCNACEATEALHSWGI